MTPEEKLEFDPVCLVHGKKMSEHYCLYCCLCFKPLTFEECHIKDNGEREDVCEDCAAQEEKLELVKDVMKMYRGFMSVMFFCHKWNIPKYYSILGQILYTDDEEENRRLGDKNEVA